MIHNDNLGHGGCIVHVADLSVAMSSSFMMVFGLVPLKVRHDASYDENPPHAFLEALTTLVLLLLPLCARVTGAGAALLRLQGGWPRPRPRRGQEHPVCRPCRARAPSAAYKPGRGAPVWPRSSAAPSSPRRCAAAACGVPQQLAPVIERRARTLAGARYPGPVCVRQVCAVCVGCANCHRAIAGDINSLSW